MNFFSSLPGLLVAAAALLLPLPAAKAAPEPATAAELAARLSANRQDGSSFIRLRMQIKDASGSVQSTLQLQIKAREDKASAAFVYQVLWPKERKGEAVLLRSVGNRPVAGAILAPPNTLKPIAAGEMKEPLFGSNLMPEDVLENFFAWDSQALVGTETIDRVACQILESKPGKGARTVYASVKSWIDPARLVPLRIEKYAASGQLLRRIETTRVATDDLGRALPANLVISSPRDSATTELDGSRIKHGVTFTEEEFTPEGLKNLTPPHSAPE